MTIHRQYILDVEYLNDDAPIDSRLTQRLTSAVVIGRDDVTKISISSTGDAINTTNLLTDRIPKKRGRPAGSKNRRHQ
jgi:hypothetical protein